MIVSIAVALKFEPGLLIGVEHKSIVEGALAENPLDSIPVRRVKCLKMPGNHTGCEDNVSLGARGCIDQLPNCLPVGNAEC